MKTHKVQIGNSIFMSGKDIGYASYEDRQIRCFSCDGDGLESLAGKIVSIAEMREFTDNPRPCRLCSQTGREPLPFEEVWGR